LTISSTIIVSLYEKKCAILVNKSTTTKMESFELELGRSVIKSINKGNHDLLGLQVDVEVHVVDVAILLSFHTYYMIV
jgi:hypothetical protein